MLQKNMGTHLGVAQLKSLENASLIKNVDHNMPHLVAKMTFDPIQRGGLALFSCFGTFVVIGSMACVLQKHSTTQLTGPMCLWQLLFVSTAGALVVVTV